jgi:hypothetical protein
VDKHIYLLRPYGASESGMFVRTGTPWETGICVFGQVVRATNEAEARSLASNHCGAEKSAPWLDVAVTYCVELSVDGPLGLVIREKDPVE